MRRWLSRDPIGEDGGLNIYSFTRNRPQSIIDKLSADYYVIESPGFPFGHWGILGDDGVGGSYILDFYSDADSKKDLNRIGGPGYYDYVPLKQDPFKVAEGLGVVIVLHRVTTRRTDKLLNRLGEELNQKERTYHVLTRNCINFVDDFDAAAKKIDTLQIYSPINYPSGIINQNIPSANIIVR